MIKYNDIEIVPTVEDHLPGIYEVLRGWPKYFTEAYSPSFDDFCNHFKKEDILSLIAIRGDEVLGFCYVNDIYPGFWGTLHGVKKKGSFKVRELLVILTLCLGYFFKTLSLEKIMAYPLEKNYGAIQLLKMVGFSKDGIFRHIRHIDGKWHDGIILSLLREEL